MSRKVSILVAEDDESMLEYVSVVLERLGFEVTQASTGREVIAALAIHSYDIVMTDHLTVDYKGTSVLQAVRMIRPGTEVIVMSGIPTLEEAATTYLAGARCYLAKPFGLDQLRGAVLKCLEATA